MQILIVLQINNINNYKDFPAHFAKIIHNELGCLKY